MKREEFHTLIEEFRSAHDIADHVDYLIAIYLAKSVDGAAELMKCSPRTVQNHIVWLTEAVGRSVLKEGNSVGTKARLSTVGIKIVKKHLPLVQSRLDNLPLFKNKSKLTSTGFTDVVKDSNLERFNSKNFNAKGHLMNSHNPFKIFIIQIVPNERWYSVRGDFTSAYPQDSLPTLIVRKTFPMNFSRNSNFKNVQNYPYDIRFIFLIGLPYFSRDDIPSYATDKGILGSLKRWGGQILDYLFKRLLRLFLGKRKFLGEKSPHLDTPEYVLEGYDESTSREERPTDFYFVQTDKVIKEYGSITSEQHTRGARKRVKTSNTSQTCEILSLPKFTLPDTKILINHPWVVIYLDIRAGKDVVFPLTECIRPARGSLIRNAKNGSEKITLFEKDTIDDVIDAALNTHNYQLLRAALNHEGYGIPLNYPNDLFVPPEWDEVELEDEEIDAGEEYIDKWNENYKSPQKFNFAQASEEKQQFAIAVANNVHLLLEHSIRQEDLLGLRVLLRLYGHKISSVQSLPEVGENSTWEDEEMGKRYLE